MLNLFISYFSIHKNLFHASQHGYVPSKGVGTAWKVILNEVIDSRDIFEFDLKGFFDSVNLEYISSTLKKKGFPVDIVKRLYYLNTSYVNVKVAKLNEFEQKMKKLIGEWKWDEIVNSLQPISYRYRVKGVPQGAPTSSVLATFALENNVLDRGVKTVMYADDGIYYGNTDQPLITPNSGMVSADISFNLEKSRWVKKDGEWLRPLKFLGLEYDGKTETLRGVPRSGKALEYNKSELLESANKRDNLQTLSWEDK